MITRTYNTARVIDACLKGMFEWEKERVRLRFETNELRIKHIQMYNESSWISRLFSSDPSSYCEDWWWVASGNGKAYDKAGANIINLAKLKDFAKYSGSDVTIDIDSFSLLENFYE